MRQFVGNVAILSPGNFFGMLRRLRFDFFFHDKLAPHCFSRHGCG